MRTFITIALITIFCTSCQDEKILEEEIIGEWTYERELSPTFNNLLDYDESGTLSFNSDGTGIWNDLTEEYNFSLTWHFDEALHSIEIAKFDKDQNLEFVENIKFIVTRQNDEILRLEFKEEIPSVLDTNQVIIHFEYITLTKK